MLDVINGGVYAVDLGGTEAYEFKGVHPALVIRTLREEQMYVVIPLTTYTAERWERCKRKGFGSRIHSTNSIARIDKMNIVTRKCIQGRYYNAGSMVVPNIAEVNKVMQKVAEYINLSNQKAQKEYSKYITQRTEFEQEIEVLLDGEKMNDFTYPFSIGEGLKFFYPSSRVSFISNADIKAIISEKIDNIGINIKKVRNLLQVEIKLCQDKLLTFKKRYDTFKAQKGSSDA